MATARLSLALFALTLATTPALAAAPSREAQVNTIIARYSASPPALRVLLQPMPKGGDLHNHLDGSVYAEDYLRWASDDGFCVAKTTHALTPPPCAPDQVPAKDLVTRDPKFYQQTIDALSMRNFVPGLGTGEVNGHDHTFATFGRFAAVGANHLDDMMIVTRRQAARDHVQYLEQIADPGVAFAPELLGGTWSFDPDDLEASLASLHPLVLKLQVDSLGEFDRAIDKLNGADSCSDPANQRLCDIEIRYLFYVLRTLPPRQVFAQMALGFALVTADPRFVGVNLVAPEDDPVALRDFDQQMRMFQFFSRRYPKVKLSLHAGELALGLVPPADLTHHIRDTVEIAGARRIGHGYSLPYETDAAGLLAEMAQKKIAVEINLTSNAITPGIVGADHPLALYRRAGVPVTLSADDEGVFRIDLTNEYVRAVTEQKLGYLDLKRIARNGIEYGFVEGGSLWQGGDYTKVVAVCAHDILGWGSQSKPCFDYLVMNTKAHLQWALEREFFFYETAVLKGPYARP